MDEEALRRLLARGIGRAATDDDRALRIVVAARRRGQCRRLREIVLTSGLALALVAGLAFTLVIRERGQQSAPQLGTPPPPVSSVPPVSSPTTAPTPTVAPPSATYAAVYAINFNSATVVDTQLHVVTIHEGIATDRLLLGNRYLDLLDANKSTALVSVDQLPQKLGTIDLHTGALRILAVDTGIGVDGILSPDSTQAVVTRGNSDGNVTTEIVDLGSGRARLLHITGGPARPGFVRWFADGLVADGGQFDGNPVGLWRINSQTGRATQLSHAEVDALSPSATVIGSAAHLSLGNSPCQCQSDWSNSLTLTQVGGATSQVAAERNRFFAPLDITDQGTLLFSKDDGAILGPTHRSDTGLDLAGPGAPQMQFPETVIGEWSGKLLNSSEALLHRWPQLGCCRTR